MILPSPDNFAILNKYNHFIKVSFSIFSNIRVSKQANHTFKKRAITYI